MVPQLLGGIGLFLLGVFLLTDGLRSAAGDALRRIVIRFTGRPVTAFVSGAGITTLMQSSSATTMATIGFVSSGLLTFSQALGVVMGASLGTTTTGWVVALVGLKYGIGSLAYPLVGLGALTRLVSHGRRASLALAVAGFGLMFVGIDTLQQGMGGLSDLLSPATLPRGTVGARLLMVGIGILLTVITQSSATAVAMTLTAFQAGMMDLAQGTSLIIGASIGTTSTSALATIGATTPAKRTALAHILFSVAAGCLAFFLAPAFVAVVRHLEISLHTPPGPLVLATFHSGFTLLAALLILPVVDRFGRLVERLIPDRGPHLTRHLDASLIEVPEVAIEALRRTLSDIAAELLEGIERRLRADEPPSSDDRAAIIEGLKESRRFLVRIPSSSSSRSDPLETRIAMVHAIDHLTQLALVNQTGPDPDLLLTVRRLQPCRSLLLEMILISLPVVRREVPTPEIAQLKKLSENMAEQRRVERASLLAESARYGTDQGRVLRTLEALRWMDTAGYHIWRALHHMGSDAASATNGQIANSDGESPGAESPHVPEITDLNRPPNPP